MIYAQVVSIIFFVLLSFDNTHCQSTQVDILFYDIELTWGSIEDSIEISASININNPSLDKRISLLFKSDIDIVSLTAHITGGGIISSYFQKANDTLLIVFPATDTTENITLDLKYNIPVDTCLRGEIVLRREERWYPLQYDDFFDVNVTALIPVGYQIYSVGPAKEKQSFESSCSFEWKSEKPITSFPIIIMRDHAHTKYSRMINGKKLNFYFYNTDSNIVNGIIVQSCGAFEYYLDILGDCGYSELNVIEISDFPAIQSLPSLLLFGSPNLKYFNYEGLGDWPAHEVAHQWFGHGVATPVKSNEKGCLFIGESLPEYLRLMYIENAFGKDTLVAKIQYSLSFYKPFAGGEKDVSLIDIYSFSSIEAAKVIYRKGPYVLHKIRQEIGDENWITFLKRIYIDFDSKMFSFNDFRKYLSNNDNNGDGIILLDKLMSEIGLPTNIQE